MVLKSKRKKKYNQKFQLVVALSEKHKKATRARVQLSHLRTNRTRCCVIGRNLFSVKYICLNIVDGC